MAAFDRAKEVISIMRELRGLLSKLLPLLASSSDAHQKMSRASGFSGSSRFVHGRIHGDRHKKHTSIREPLPNRDPIPETLGNTPKVYSIFVASLPTDLSIANFKDLFSSCGEIVDAYIPNNFGENMAEEYGFIRYANIQEGLQAIELLNGKSIGDCKLHVMWARYQKRLPVRGRTGSSFTRKKIVWKWIPRANNVPNYLSLSPYKQVLLSNPNGNGFEGQKSANEVVEEGVHFPSQQLPSWGSSLKGDEEMDSSQCPFDSPLEMELRHHEKSERGKLSSKGKKRINKSPKSVQCSPTLLKL
ncbi:hypothetical protein Cgig2_021898 [Carnegiea gigantea]|uniref:RRM domain-containing protein n=1 Tax=Carnegiea gigantea TaxID=171969 RepID=A0A9Q1GWE3_9CARY|nr:hypothetical protein Cgig2_021898 [Carnegiea gigantea]